MYDERLTVISLCASVWKTTMTILECVFHHHEFFTPGGETFYMHEKSCALGAAQIKDDGLWNYLQKSCSPRQAVAEGDEVICMWYMPKAKQQRSTSPSWESSPMQSCTCSGICPATAYFGSWGVFWNKTHIWQAFAIAEHVTVILWKIWDCTVVTGA